MKLIRVHEDDNVAVALSEIETGESLDLPWGGRLVAREGVPVSHKVAVTDIPAGRTIRRYGQPIGTAARDIFSGDWVHTHNLRSPDEIPPMTSRPESAAPADLPAPDHFSGYARAKGPAGVRNHLLVMSTVACANGVVRAIGRAVPQAVTIEHAHGCGRVGPDHERTQRVLSGAATHPNTGAVLLVGLGCEIVSGEAMHREVAESGRPVEYLKIQDAGSRRTTEKGVELGRRLLSAIAGQAREPRPVSDLILGLQCGGSDALSGVTANPAVGLVSDWIVGYGGTVIMAETTEMIGTLHLLQARALDDQVAGEIQVIIAKNQDLARKMLGEQAHLAIAPGNMDGGLSSIMEKSLGCITKGGRTTIQEVVPYGRRPLRPGLAIMDTPGYDVESLGGLLGAGCQACLFTTGRGSPVGTPLMPVIKISSNTDAFRRMDGDIDVNAGEIADGRRGLEEMGRVLWEQTMDVLAGRLSRAEENRQEVLGISMTIEAG
ncbi:MAG: altronate dehydratase family protein [Proteobacteria bacterium]|nr:altronate dehydratase family protein [Pseudomonadota bacterium]